jgi:hypothetical protein
MLPGRSRMAVNAVSFTAGCSRLIALRILPSSASAAPHFAVSDVRCLSGSLYFCDLACEVFKLAFKYSLVVRM